MSPDIISCPLGNKIASWKFVMSTFFLTNILMSVYPLFICHKHPETHQSWTLNILSSLFPLLGFWVMLKKQSHNGFKIYCCLAKCPCFFTLHSSILYSICWNSYPLLLWFHFVPHRPPSNSWRKSKHQKISLSNFCPGT